MTSWKRPCPSAPPGLRFSIQADHCAISTGVRLAWALTQASSCVSDLPLLHRVEERLVAEAREFEEHPVERAVVVVVAVFSGGERPGLVDEAGQVRVAAEADPGAARRMLGEIGGEEVDHGRMGNRGATIAGIPRFAIAHPFSFGVPYRGRLCWTRSHAKGHPRHHGRPLLRDLPREAEDGACDGRGRPAPPDPRGQHQPAGAGAHRVLQVFRQQAHPGARRRGDDLPEDPHAGGADARSSGRWSSAASPAWCSPGTINPTAADAGRRRARCACRSSGRR